MYLRLCPERHGQTEQHPSDTEQEFWTGSIGSTVRGGQTELGGITENCGVLHIDTSM
jgi:hypothetical protein